MVRRKPTTYILRIGDKEEEVAIERLKAAYLDREAVNPPTCPWPSHPHLIHHRHLQRPMLPRHQHHRQPHRNRTHKQRKCFIFLPFPGRGEWCYFNEIFGWKWFSLLTHLIYFSYLQIIPFQPFIRRWNVTYSGRLIQIASVT